MNGASDEVLIEQCRAEKRILVSLDLEFANPLVYKPSMYAGIAVLRLPRRVGPNSIANAIEIFARALDREQIAGKLWIVEARRIRVYQEGQN